ncbi:acyl-CoA dehydrogenase [Fulvivirga sp.]|uniref:acyl-CoA dehydrogenase family protein n=1 Tax=Fulvivirga sp. TaxID=1931237 RepID=UPI0032ED2634
MIHSEELKKNPNLYLFLPIYYALWADSILTKAEQDTLNALLKSQNWLSGNELQFLQSYLDPKKDVRPKELKEWKSKILTADIKKNRTLTDLGLDLANNHSNGQKVEISDDTISAFREAERQLGMISNEVNYIFQDEHKTVTGNLSRESNFDISSMTAILEGHDAEVIRKVKAVIASPNFKYPAKESLAQQREDVYKLCQVLAEHGFGAWAFPKEYGGKGDMGGYFTIMETLSFHDLSMVIKFGVQFGLWGMSVFFLGTERHHKKYLKDIGTLKIPGCFAMTETNHGSNVKGIETTATYHHSNKTITIHTPHDKACKEYIGNAAIHGQMATVFAKLMIDGTDYGVSAFVVPIRTADGKAQPGVTIEDCGPKMGLNGVDNGKIWFDNVIIPAENMLDKFAGIDENGEFTSPITSDNRRFFTMLGTLVGGRIGIPRSGLSATKSGLTIALRYADGRKQFGPQSGEEVPILNYRLHQRRLLPPLATAYALHFSLKYLTSRFLKKTEEDAQEIEALAAGLKAYTTWFTTSTLQECREACGGKGYLGENRIPDLKADTDVYTTFEGDNTVLMQLVAKNRLTEFKQEFHNMSLVTVFNYVAEKAKVNIVEKNPLAVRNTDEEHLLDFDFHMKAFTYREESILSSAAQRLKRLIEDGMDSFDAFNVSGHHMVNVGKAYIERIILEQFQDQVERTTDVECQQVLRKLAQLFALYTIENNRGWYLEQGYMEGVKTKSIRKLVNQLNWEIRQDAIALTDAFDIPDHCLAADIAVSDS